MVQEKDTEDYKHSCEVYKTGNRIKIKCDSAINCTPNFIISVISSINIFSGKPGHKKLFDHYRLHMQFILLAPTRNPMQARA